MRTKSKLGSLAVTAVTAATLAIGVAAPAASAAEVTTATSQSQPSQHYTQETAKTDVIDRFLSLLPDKVVDQLCDAHEQGLDEFKQAYERHVPQALQDFIEQYVNVNEIYERINEVCS